MTAGTAHAHCRMNVVFGKIPLIVAAVAEIRLFRQEPSRNGVRFFVRHSPGIDRRVACRTAHLKGLMHELPFCQLSVTGQAFFFLGCGKRTQKDWRKQQGENNKKKSIHGCPSHRE
jgi:hypothetical protein